MADAGSARARRAWEILGACLDKGPEEQAEILGRACGGDDELRREVESLLTARRDSESFLEGAPDEPPETLATPLPAEDPARPAAWPAAPTVLEAGRRLGPYKILDLLSRGGMGEVYLAVREYEDFDKRVALKVLQQDMQGREEILRRFRTEQRILGFLDHPNIAGLLDGGTTDGGRPYLVMEYVEGEPVDVYCERRKLGVEERLEIFLAVCSAVDFAHRNTVVHRDIKPANILVTQDGIPKLLDFGIAKLLNPELTARAVAPTRVRVWTPEYASPEQVKDEPITTASDVYSLGVLLYVLLTGRHPYGRSTSSELDRAIVEEDPPKPSTLSAGAGSRPGEAASRDRAAGARKLRRRLAGDLDNIVLKAMRKEPRRRYGSVESFAEDIRRHLSGHPVVARGDSFPYRAGKFVRRHRFGVGAVAAFMLATLAFGVAMAFQQARLSEALAGEELVTDFLTDLFEVSDPLAAAQPAVVTREILDRGRDRLRSELRDRPEAQSRLMATIGSVYVNLGEYQEAESLLREALGVRRGVAGDPPDGVLADILLSLAEVVRARGGYDDAEGMLREALEARRALFGARAFEVAQVLNDLASLSGFRGEFERSEELYQEALEILRAGGERADLANVLNNLANLYKNHGRFDRAEKLFRESLTIRRDVLDPGHPLVANSLNNLAAVLQSLGQLDEAGPLFREALTILRERLGKDHPWVAFSLVSYAHLLAEAADFAEAEVQAREALAVLEGALPPGHWQIGATESLLGECLTGLQRYAEAGPHLVAGLRALESSEGVPPRQVERARERLEAYRAASGR